MYSEDFPSCSSSLHSPPFGRSARALQYGPARLRVTFPGKSPWLRHQVKTQSDQCVETTISRSFKYLTCSGLSSTVSGTIPESSRLSYIGNSTLSALSLDERNPGGGFRKSKDEFVILFSCVSVRVTRTKCCFSCESAHPARPG